MTHFFILGVLALCVALSAVLLHARIRIRGLEAALHAAREAQRSQASILSERSELDLIKDEFISTVSHELRTPLTSIRGALGLLSAGLMGTMDEKAQNLLRIAVTNTDRLIRLINAILDLERMQSGQTPLVVRRCALTELVQQAIETMTAMAEAVPVKLELTTSQSVGATYMDVDADRMLQVMTNLLSNAIKFSPAEGVISVRIEARADAVQVRVQDQGRGIPPEKLESVFDRFQQVEVSDARQKGGTGLGLAISRTIVHQHDGTIWAESNPAKRPGATFILSLPRVGRTIRQDLEGPVTLGEGTILICDDDPGIRTIVAENLRQHGYRILEAERGEQAIELAEKNQVEAILLDLFMPGMTGWETLQRLKNTAATATIPVVILSVLPPVGTSEKSSQAARAAQGWVQKPFNEHLLLTELSRVLHEGEGTAHVLLVEDDADLAAVVIAGFEDANVVVAHAQTRQAAIEQCLILRPDLLILDLTLPDGDGFSLVDWLRQQPDLKMLPLVVYSGREVSDAEMSQLRLGPTQFLTKAKVQPHEVEELVLNIVRRLRKPVGRAG